MRRTALLAPALLLSVALVACSSSTKGSGSHGASSTTAKSAATTSAAGSSAANSSAAGGAAPDEAKLKSLLLTQADVPAGWTGTPASTDTTAGDAQKKQLETCIGVPDSSQFKVAEAQSQDFGLNNSSISSTADSFRSQDVVDKDVQGIQNPKAGDCFKQSFQSLLTTELPAGAKVDSFDLTVTPGSNGGPSNVAAMAHGHLSVTVQSQTVSLFIDVAFITGHLIEAQVDFFGFGTQIDTATQAKAISAVATRVAAA